MIFSQEVSRYSVTHLLPTSDSELFKSQDGGDSDRHSTGQSGDHASEQSRQRPPPRVEKRLSSLNAALFYATVAVFALFAIVFSLYVLYARFK
ncbi:hypothetical protein HPB51_017199 [Rhipicephalus microplus]|uniref:Uncharacterized protein n=1 Tax=Rhipicephalus microplus TaxID=6941 RepID=A0A9J6EA73_RHIMP|nr:hypothetical protein HPB51_017199 [Rhipicephalus microplus]